MKLFWIKTFSVNIFGIEKMQQSFRDETVVDETAIYHPLPHKMSTKRGGIDWSFNTFSNVTNTEIGGRAA